MKQIVECVPNLSEGRDQNKIREIAAVVPRPGVKLLDVSSDPDHNRSVITFAGRPGAVMLAAFRLIKKTAALIAKDPEFKALVEEHRQLDEKLKELDRKVYLLPDEEVERKRLQKLKLARKDKIAQILNA